MEPATLNQLIQKLRDLAEANAVLKTFQWDEEHEINTESQLPFLLAFEDGINQTGIVMSVRLKLAFMDLVRKDGRDKFTVSSEMLEVAKGYIAELRKPSDILILDDTNITYTAFYDQLFDHEAHGWGVEVVVKMANVFDACDSPGLAIVTENNESIVTENNEIISYV